MHPLSIVKITKYVNYEPRFNSVFSRYNLHRIKYGVNLNDRQSKETHSVSLFIDRIITVYFESSGIEYIPPELLDKIKDKFITYNIFGIHSDDSIMCGFYFIVFIEYMITGKTFLDYTNLLSPNDYKKITR